MHGCRTAGGSSTASRQMRSISRLSTTARQDAVPRARRWRRMRRADTCFSIRGPSRGATVRRELVSCAGRAGPDRRRIWRSGLWSWRFGVFRSRQWGLVDKGMTGESLPDCLAWFDRSGRLVERLGPFPFGSFGVAELSPNGTQLAMQSPGGDHPRSDIWLFDTVRGQQTQLTFSEGPDRATRSGRLMASEWRLLPDRPDAPGLYLKSTESDQPEELLFRSKRRCGRSTGLRTGHRAASCSKEAKTARALISGSFRWTMIASRIPSLDLACRATRSVSQRQMGRVPHRDPANMMRSKSSRRISPGGTKHRLSTTGGRAPRWRHDGKELFYVADRRTPGRPSRRCRRHEPSAGYTPAAVSNRTHCWCRPVRRVG